MAALKHIAALSEQIGPRGSTTEGERRGHDYCRECAQRLGYRTREETFTSPGSAYRLYLLCAGLLLLSFALFHFQILRVAAGVVAWVATLSAVLELAFLPSPLRLLLPVRTSQNVVAEGRAREAAHRKIIFVAHVDTHRTPLIWRSPGTFRAYRLLSSSGIAGFFGMAVFMSVEALAEMTIPAALWAVAVVFVAAIFAMTLQAELTPFTRGANDNASGVALALSLAEKYAQQPLHYSEPWFVFTGCEEVGAHGAFAFIKSNKPAIDRAIFIVLDNLAGRDTTPHFHISETMLRPLRYPSRLLQLAESIAQQNPALGARPFAQRGAFTDGTPFLLAGLPGLTIVNHDSRGWIPNWHRLTDTLAEVDAQALARTQQFIERIVEVLDKETV